MDDKTTCAQCGAVADVGLIFCAKCGAALRPPAPLIASVDIRNGGATMPTANAPTLERWRPHPIVFIYCLLAIALLGIASFLAIFFLVAWWYQPEGALAAALVGALLFVAVFLLSLRRCSTPALPAFRGLLLMTAYMSIGVGSFFLLFVIPTVVFAVISIIAIAFVSLFGKDAPYARDRFRRLVEFYRRHRMYQ
jgi:hypothetical protein